MKRNWIYCKRTWCVYVCVRQENSKYITSIEEKKRDPQTTPWVWLFVIAIYTVYHFVRLPYIFDKTYAINALSAHVHHENYTHSLVYSFSLHPLLSLCFSSVYRFFILHFSLSISHSAGTIYHSAKIFFIFPFNFFSQHQVILMRSDAFVWLWFNDSLTLFPRHELPYHYYYSFLLLLLLCELMKER